jgi:hypothetical protein
VKSKPSRERREKPLLEQCKALIYMRVGLEV